MMDVMAGGGEALGWHLQAVCTPRHTFLCEVLVEKMNMIQIQNIPLP